MAKEIKLTPLPGNPTEKDSVIFTQVQGAPADPNVKYLCGHCGKTLLSRLEEGRFGVKNGAKFECIYCKRYSKLDDI